MPVRGVLRSWAIDESVGSLRSSGVMAWVLVDLKLLAFSVKGGLVDSE